MSEIDFRTLIPPECYEILQHVWDLLDGQLTEETQAQLERHVAECAQCRKYKAFQEQFLAAMHHSRSIRCAPEHLRTRIEHSLAEAGFTGKI